VKNSREICGKIHEKFGSCSVVLLGCFSCEIHFVGFVFRVRFRGKPHRGQVKLKIFSLVRVFILQIFSVDQVSAISRYLRDRTITTRLSPAEEVVVIGWWAGLHHGRSSKGREVLSVEWLGIPMSVFCYYIQYEFAITVRTPDRIKVIR
jgi:hypothetical protein